jgi:uncharacterized cupin superfamily protein
VFWKTCAMVPEARLQRTNGSSVPHGEGWFVLNAADARWLGGDLGRYTRFEGEPPFPQIGINIGVLKPGEPASMYHRENEQEDFLVLSGACLLLVEGEERLLRQWDFVHCPAGTEHVFIGAGDRLCAVLAVGGRSQQHDTVYPANELAQRHRAGSPVTTSSGEQAYESSSPDLEVPYEEGWLPSD